MFLLEVESGLTLLFIQRFKRAVLLSSVLHGFWWEICGRLNHCPLFVVFCDSLATCKISLSLVFSGLIMMCLDMVFFEFVLSGVHRASYFFFFFASYIFKLISFKHFRSLQPLFVQMFSSASIPFSSASRIPVTYVLDLFIFSPRSIGSVHFYKSYFSWLFRSDSFFWSVFKFTDSFLCYLHSATELHRLTFCSSKIMFVSLNVFFLSFFFEN